MLVESVVVFEFVVGPAEVVDCTVGWLVVVLVGPAEELLSWLVGWFGGC